MASSYQQISPPPPLLHPLLPRPRTLLAPHLVIRPNPHRLPFSPLPHFPNHVRHNHHIWPAPSQPRAPAHQFTFGPILRYSVMEGEAVVEIPAL